MSDLRRNASKRFFRGIARAGMIVAMLGLAACSSTSDDADLATTDIPAEELYNQGLALRNEGRLSEASEKFAELDKYYPYSEYARKSLINVAYVSYTRGKYPEAINAAKRFTTLYPGNPDSAYALYIIGQSYFKQIPDVTRDQQNTQRALAAFGELVQRFPDSEYASDAETKIRATEDQLAGKEMEVGRYYLKRDNYVAAINRFKTVVINYQTTRHIEEALFRLVESYYALGVINEAQTAAAVLGHNYPDSQWYKDAYNLLQTGGYSPESDGGSWISKAFGSISVL
ncbi:outer membrane protein assembly factor BamD [Rhizobiales bacterium]|uniref:outer membrane protein assembly factor BamD n=1 Tax=Hongsoonwoonella zoysiae TaxID=2821844 RepID=UPI00156164B9|nr:outer membrane protein assembly factor BamD [Hongsoonwoonella zoysiae]